MMNRLLHVSVSVSALIALLFATHAQAQTCPFDDGNSSLEVEGLILTRYALGLTGAPLVASTGINAVDAPTVEATINCPSCGLNITGNPTLTVADATIISRKLAGFSGAALTDNLALGVGTRNTPVAVQSFLLGGCGATGGINNSATLQSPGTFNISGNGLIGGNLGVGTIAPVSRLNVAIGTNKTTVATTRAFAITTNEPLGANGDAANPFALDIRLVGAAALADRAVHIQSTDFNTADGGTIVLQPGAGNVGIGTAGTGSRLTVAGTIESTSGGVKFPDGTTQTTSAAGRQVWSSNNLLGTSALTQLIGVASGVGIGGNSFRALALPLSQTCTASNFTASVVGATGTSLATVYLVSTTPAQLATGSGSGVLSCPVTASAGNVVACTSSDSIALQTPVYLTTLFQVANTVDFNNARAYVSFTCK